MSATYGPSGKVLTSAPSSCCVDAPVQFENAVGPGTVLAFRPAALPGPTIHYVLWFIPGRPGASRAVHPKVGTERILSQTTALGAGLDRHGGLDASALLPPDPSPGTAGIARGAVRRRPLGRSAVHARNGEPGA